jgi:mannose-6-phosphate isomerase-like protein (cupin superfamily)
MENLMADQALHNTVLLRSEESDGAVSVIQNGVPANWPGPPLHRHDFDEAFYVLEGELTFQVVDELVTAGPGELVFAPRGVAHTFANLSDAPARYMLVCTPAGFERYFARMAAERGGVDPPDWALQPTPPVTRVGPSIGDR